MAYVGWHLFASRASRISPLINFRRFVPWKMYLKLYPPSKTQLLLYTPVSRQAVKPNQKICYQEDALMKESATFRPWCHNILSLLLQIPQSRCLEHHVWTSSGVTRLWLRLAGRQRAGWDGLGGNLTGPLRWSERLIGRGSPSPDAFVHVWKIWRQFPSSVECDQEELGGAGTRGVTWNTRVTKLRSLFDSVEEKRKPVPDVQFNITVTSGYVASSDWEKCFSED